MAKKALLALEDGSLFYGTSIGTEGNSTGEVVFNTALTGYQEILTDPSYYKQIVTLTHPHIGNVGTNPEDEESANVYVGGLIIRDLSPIVSNWRASESLGDYLKRNNVIAISNIDTRKLTRHLRQNGTLKGCLIAADDINEKRAIETAKAFQGLVGLDLVKEVSTPSHYEWNEGTQDIKKSNVPVSGERPYHVIAYDYGIKRNLLRILADCGCKSTVVAAHTPASDVLAQMPDGVFLSNGPGDPESCDYTIKAIQEIIAAGLPVFGICLGHQLLSLALGARTVKMKFGHHGANHPVQALEDRRVMITSQNHSFVVDEADLPDSLLVTHRSLFDGSLQGVHHREKPVFGFQGHPEASPGPHDLKPLFHHFIALMQQYKTRK